MGREEQQEKERKRPRQARSRRRFVLYQDMLATPNGRLHGRLRRERLGTRRARLAVAAALLWGVVLWGLLSETVF